MAKPQAKKTKLAPQASPKPVVKAALPPEKQKKTNNPTTAWLLLSALGFIVITLIAFWGGFNNEFIDWDDHVYIENNYLVTQPSWANVGKAFRTGVALNYHPLTIISLIFNAAIWGSEKATSFIVTNSLIHAANVLLAFGLAWLLSKRNWFVAMVTALLFSFHPMRVESVTWVSERKDVLYGFFFLLGCITYVLHLRQQQRKWLVWTFVLFVLSCLSKAQAVVLPVVLLLIDYWENRPLSPKLVIEKWAFWTVALLFGWIATDIQAAGNFYGLTQTVGVQKKALDLAVFGTGERLMYALYGFMMYCYHLIYPVDLCGFYPYEKDLGYSKYYVYGIPFFVVVVGLTALSLRKTKLVGFGLGFFFVTVALVLQFISVGAAIMADRYTYVPYFGFFFLIAMALSRLSAQMPQLKYPVWAAMVAFLAFCFYRTTQQVKVWHDSGTFFGQIIKYFPDDHRAYSTRGRYLGMNGKLDEGISDLENAIRLGNTDPSTYENLGTGYGFKGDTKKAVEMFTKAIQMGSTESNVYFNRGIGNLTINPQQAVEDFEKAIQLNPEKAKNIRGNLGLAYIKVNNPTKALENLNIDIDQQSNRNANNYFNRAVAKSQLNDRNGAIEDLRNALRADPKFEQARQQLAAMGVQP